MGPTVEVSVVEIFELVWDNKHDALKIQIVFVNVQSEKITDWAQTKESHIEMLNAVSQSKQHCVSAVLH